MRTRQAQTLHLRSLTAWEQDTRHCRRRRSVSLSLCCCCCCSLSKRRTNAGVDVAGLAGLSAAHTLYERGANVLLLDKVRARVFLPFCSPFAASRCSGVDTHVPPPHTHTPRPRSLRKHLAHTHPLSFSVEPVPRWCVHNGSSPALVPCADASSCHRTGNSTSERRCIASLSLTASSSADEWMFLAHRGYVWHQRRRHSRKSSLSPCSRRGSVFTWSVPAHANRADSSCKGHQGHGRCFLCRHQEVCAFSFLSLCSALGLAAAHILGDGLPPTGSRARSR